MPNTMSVRLSRRADSSVSASRTSTCSIASADTTMKAARWWRKANSADMARIIRYLKNSGCEARAQVGLDFPGRAREGEEVALADAAARIGEELALRVILHALRHHLEAHPARERDEGPREVRPLGVARNAGEELA